MLSTARMRYIMGTQWGSTRTAGSALSRHWVYGPFVVHNSEYRSLKADDDVYVWRVPPVLAQSSCKLATPFRPEINNDGNYGPLKTVSFPQIVV